MKKTYLRRQVNFDQFKTVRRKKRVRSLILGLALLLVLGGAAYGVYRTGLLQTVSFVARLINPVQLKEEEGRVNVLILGLDTRGDNWSGLTDTILVGSISQTEGDPVLISLPRDFWVSMTCPIALGAKKINAAYNCGGGAYSSGKFDQGKAISLAKAKVEEILGIKIPYYAVVNFEGFKEVVDTLGGVNVCIEEAFTDNAYPVAGRENAYPVYSRYEVVKFSAGCQTLTGDRALKYARSRHGTANGDFDRARRQQQVMMGVKDKILTLDFFLNPQKVATLFSQLNKAVKTNVTLGELQRGMDIAASLKEISAPESLVLDTNPELGLMIHPPTPRYGAYVIIPTAGETNYTQIQKKVRALLYAPKIQEAQGDGNQ